MMDDDFVIDEEIMDDDTPTQPVKPPTKVEQEEPTMEEHKPASLDNLDPTANLFNADRPVNMYEEIEKEEQAMGFAPIDFSRLNDPSYTPFVEKFMKLKRRKSNMMTLEEFNRYRPIFDPNSKMPPEDKQKLYTDWQFRVSQRDPVEVYDNGRKVLTIPPIFAETKDLSAAGQQAVAGIIDAFHNANDTDFDFNNRQQYWGNQMIKAFQVAQMSNDLDKQRRDAELMALEAVGFDTSPITSPKQSTRDSNVSNNDTVPSHTSNMENDDELVDDDNL